MNIVFEPDIIFTTEEIWKDYEKRDMFLSFLLHILDFIDSDDDCYILWNDDLESMLWIENIHPWKIDKDFYNTLIPIISHRIQTNKLNVEIPIFQHKLECIPCFKFDITNENIIDNFYKMLHQEIHNHAIPNILVTEKNDKTFSISCIDIEEEITPITFLDLKETINIENDINRIWDDLNIENFIKGINDIHKKIIFKDRNFLYNFDVDLKFIKDVEDIYDNRLRLKIMTQLIKKLVYSFVEAQNDKSLNDEMIGEITGRFRISQVMRVEYIYQNNIVTFTHFYPKGKHDVGIRHT